MNVCDKAVPTVPGGSAPAAGVIMSVAAGGASFVTTSV
ncbi:hypothetical protein BN132_3353 [Cronobacter turicensis 564]|nr:hypothetical protein BN132_3353 [Cronobacter turicensis 564]